MFKDITIGQYYPADSFIHRLDPRLKIIGVMVYIIAAFFVRTYIGMAVLLGYQAWVWDRKMKAAYK